MSLHSNILENEKFDEDITVIEDKLLWTRIANHFPIIQINKETVVYTLHEDNSINLKNNPSLKCWDGLKIFFKRYPEINIRIPKRIKRNIISDTLFGIAKCYIYNNQKLKAIYFILYSIIIKPFHFQTKHKIYQIGAVLGILKQNQYIKEFLIYWKFPTGKYMIRRAERAGKITISGSPNRPEARIQ